MKRSLNASSTAPPPPKRPRLTFLNTILNLLIQPFIVNTNPTTTNDYPDTTDTPLLLPSADDSHSPPPRLTLFPPAFPNVNNNYSQYSVPPSLTLSTLPHDIYTVILPYLTEPNDYAATSATCNLFRAAWQMNVLRRQVVLSTEGRNGGNIITPTDTPFTAHARLVPFLLASHPTAIYYAGMLMCYTGTQPHDITTGVQYLTENGYNNGHVRSLYSLGLLLRDSDGPESHRALSNASEQGYLPAQQEILDQAAMKALYGEPSAIELSKHLQDQCLSDVMKKHYVSSDTVRKCLTSHCWNPRCGSWAFKARGPVQDEGAVQNHPPAPQNFFLPPPNPNNPPNNPSPTGALSETPTGSPQTSAFQVPVRVSRMKMCSSCQRAKYCSKLCQIVDWRSGRHKKECGFIGV